MDIASLTRSVTLVFTESHRVREPGNPCNSRVTLTQIPVLNEVRVNPEVKTLMLLDVGKFYSWCFQEPHQILKSAFWFITNSIDNIDNVTGYTLICADNVRTQALSFPQKEKNYRSYAHFLVFSNCHYLFLSIFRYPYVVMMYQTEIKAPTEQS